MPEGIFGSCQGTQQTTETTTTQSSSSSSGAAQPTSWTSWIFPILILVVFVVLIIVPQKRRDKKVKDMLSGIKEGDRIRTIGGIYGTVVQVKEDLITIESGPDKTKIVFAKGAVSTIESADVEADDVSMKS